MLPPGRWPNEREAFLAKACGSDAALRQEVESRLRADANTQLGAPTSGLDAPTAATPARPPGPAGVEHERPGTHIGPYKLIRSIGEGGFGSVFMAEQERPVVRKVALKIIKLGMDTREVVARFEQER